MLAKIFKLITISLIQFYRLIISPIIRPTCRFMPTCSEYATESIKLHGFIAGSILAAKRLLKCNPFGSSGFDPVPEKKVKNKNH